MLPDFLFALNNNRVVMLCGDTGTGKSYVASEVFEAAGWAFETINMHSAVTAGQIIGKYDPNDKGAFVWHDGPLIRAMKDGKPLLIEEANAMTSAVSLCLYAPMDKDPKKRKLTLIAHEGETITAHPDFRLVLTGNLGYRGTERFNPAIQNRIADYISLPYLSQELEAQLLMKTSKIDKDTAQNMARVASAVRANREKSGFRPLSTRTMQNWSEKVKGGFEPMRAAETTIIPTLADEEKEKDIVREFVKSVFQRKKKLDDD